MKENLKLGLILAIITSVAGLFLGVANELTKDVIAQNSKMNSDDLAYILPEATGVKDFEFTTEDGSTVSEVYEAVSGNSTAGYVIKVSPKGYGGPIDMLVGVKADGALGGIKILAQSETPGLGARVEEEAFQAKFKDLDIKDGIKVVKGSASAPSEVEGITGATISSNAVGSGITEAINFYKENVLGEEVVAGKELDLASLGLEGVAEEVNVDLAEGITKVSKVGTSFIVEVEETGMHEGLNFAVAIAKDGTITGIQILEHEETPGLGDVIEGEDFRGKFVGLTDTTSVETVSGATLSSTAVKSGAQKALDFFNANLKVEPKVDELGLSGNLESLEVTLTDNIVGAYKVSNGGFVVEVEETGMHEGVVVAVGISTDGKISGVQIMAHSETAGLGDAIEGDDFRSKFVGLTDVSGVDIISGATLSSNAVKRAAESALSFYNGNLK